MRYTASDKMEIIRLVEESSLPVRQTLARLDIRRSTFYNWLKRYEEGGLDALADRKPSPISLVWNKLTQSAICGQIRLRLLLLLVSIETGCKASTGSVLPLRVR